MAIAMRLRNQLQSVYKLDPLRNEVRGGFLQLVRDGGDRTGSERPPDGTLSRELPTDGCLRRADGDGQRACLRMRTAAGSDRVVLRSGVKSSFCPTRTLLVISAPCGRASSGVPVLLSRVGA